MGEARRFPPQGAVDEDLLWRVGDVVLAPDDVGDGHQMIVHHDGVVVGGHSVALDEYDVLEFSGVLLLQPVAHALDAPVDAVVEGHVLPRLHLEDDGLPVAVGPALVQQLPGVLPVQVQSLGLAVGTVVAALVRALVPVQPQPPHAGHDGLLVLLRRAGPVRVLDAQDEASPRVAGPQPVEQGGVPAPDVQGPRWAGRKAHPHVFVLRHDPSSNVHSVDSARPLRRRSWPDAADILYNGILKDYSASGEGP